VDSLPLSVLTWNVSRRGESVLDPLAALPDLPDIVTLQEVTPAQSDVIRKRLLRLRYSSVYSGIKAASEKRYGNVIAARIPMASFDAPASGFPWPQLVARAVLETDAGPVNVINVHVPNGSSNGWKKIETLEALRKLVLSLKGEPLILTGDFNEPRWTPLQDGRIVTWGQDEHKGRWLPWGAWTFDGITGTGKRWDSAVRWFFEHSHDSGIRNAFWDIAGHGAMEASHFSRGAERWFDHIFVSSCFRVAGCGYLHSFRERGFSDHSPLTATLLANKARRPTGCSRG